MIANVSGNDYFCNSKINVSVYMKERIKSLVISNKNYVSTCFEHLHAHPELSFQETETSLFVQRELTKLNIPFRAGIAGTGILAKVEGKNPSKKIIALRADMDALPICELVQTNYTSKNNGVMHACGHDAHTACLLGVAKILSEIKDNFEGTVLLIFQPGEEKAPGGARLMLEDNLFNDLEPEIIIAQHVSIEYPTGTMGFKSGMIMASADEIHITIKGNGGHGALPHLCNDSVLAAAQTLVSLQQVRSRLCHPLTPMVLTFGRMIADGAQNVIPNEVTLSGTLRTVNEKWRSEAKEHIKNIVHQTALAYGCTADISIPDGYPCVINNTPVTEKAIKYATEWVGEENIVELEMRMTSEDFAFFTQKYPSVFYRFGVKGKTNSDSGGLHTPTFKIDQDALLTGTGGLAWLAIRFLQ